MSDALPRAPDLLPRRVPDAPWCRVGRLEMEGLQWLTVRRQLRGTWPPTGLEVRVRRRSPATFDFELQALGQGAGPFRSAIEPFAVAACSELAADRWIAPCGTDREACLQALADAVAHVQAHHERPPMLEADRTAA